MLKAGRPSVNKKVEIDVFEPTKKKRINFDIDEDTHSRLKIYAAKNGKTIKDVVLEHIKMLLESEGGDQKA
jgi:NRPS condensation-like uncharacterized protein